MEREKDDVNCVYCRFFTGIFLCVRRKLERKDTRNVMSHNKFFEKCFPKFSSNFKSWCKKYVESWKQSCVKLGQHFLYGINFFFLNGISWKFCGKHLNCQQVCECTLPDFDFISVTTLSKLFKRSILISKFNYIFT